MTRALALAMLAACSAPATLSDLKVAEARADRGDVDGAVAAYRDAQVSCKKLHPRRRAVQACGEALLGEAETLERAGRRDEALAAYVAIPPRAPDDTTAAIARYRAGTLEAGDARLAAWTDVVTKYPDEPIAGDALRGLLAARRGDPAFTAQLRELAVALEKTHVADNVLWTLADLTEHELNDPAGARALYDRIPRQYPDSGLRDDARWHGARISRALGDARGAVERLRGLLATREVAWGAGSYFSIWLDDAQLALGQILRDDLHDLPAAAQAFEQLPKDYPASILRDDALFELAVTRVAEGDRARACAAVAKLPADSKYVARAKEQQLCPPR